MRERLARVRHDLTRFDKAVRWVEPHNIHLTLKFLGEVADARIMPICDAVRRAAEGTGPFELDVAGLGCFPPQGRANVVWAGLAGDLAPLRTLVERLETQMHGLGFERERRPFAPHLTIGRVRDARQSPALRAAVEKLSIAAGRSAVQRIVLFDSLLTERGPVYSAVAHADLKMEAGQ